MLFIGEAYAFVERREGSFGDEAINTIMQEMENSRESTIVVFAGYPDKMEAFFLRNPGLRSRVPFQIHVDGFSAGEMYGSRNWRRKSAAFSSGRRRKNRSAPSAQRQQAAPIRGTDAFAGILWKTRSWGTLRVFTGTAARCANRNSRWKGKISRCRKIRRKQTRPSP